MMDDDAPMAGVGRKLRPAPHRPGILPHARLDPMKYCAQCRQQWADTFRYCPNDAAPLQAQPPDPLVGQCLANKYEIVEPVSRDRYGTLYRARHRYADQPCAVRLLRPELTREPEQVERLRKMVRIGLDWRSPHIVGLHDLDSVAGGGFFLAEEWIEGKTLQALLHDQGRLPASLCAAIATQVCQALVDAHAQQLPHGRLTAGSVIVSGDEPAVVAKVGGFGLAWVAGGATADDLTMLGALLFRLLTGEEAFLAGGETEEPPLRPAAELRAALRASQAPAHLAEAAGALLGLGPGPRPRTPAEAFPLLDRGAAAVPAAQIAPTQVTERDLTLTGRSVSSGGEAAPEADLFTMLEERPRSAGRRWALAAVLVVVLGAGSYWLLRGRSAPAPASDGQAPAQAAGTTLPPVDYQVVERNGEGEPGHHAHLVVRIAGAPVYIVRERGSYPSTTARAEAVTGALQQAAQRLLQDPAPRFRIADDNGVPAIVQENEDGSGTLTIITITPADVQAYNARGRRKITAGELAEWWLARTVDYLGLFALGQKPSLTTRTADGAALARLYESARAAQPAQPGAVRLPSAELSQALSRLDTRDRDAIQDSVFLFPGDSPHTTRDSPHATH